MKSCKSISFLLRLLLVLPVAADAADAPPLTFKFSTSNVPGAVQTFTGDINNAGVTVGQYEDKRKVFHGFILSGKNLITVDDPQGTNTVVNGIQYNGMGVVGAYTNSAGNSVGFLYKNGKFTDIPGPSGATAASASSINDKGVTVGYYLDSGGVQHGFRLTGKTYKTLDVPGAIGTGADGINNKGNMVLFWVDSKGNGESSISYDGGRTYKTINVPGAVYSAASDLNNECDVAYEWVDSSDAVHGALLHKGKYYKFDYPKAVFTYAGGINDKNTLVGGYEAKNNGPFSSYKATFKQ